MLLRNILAFADSHPGSDARLETAAALTEEVGGHLVAVACTAHPGFHMGYQSVAGSQVYFEDVNRAHTEAQEMMTAVKATLERLGRSGDVRWGSDTIAGLGEIAATHAYYSDLAVVGQPTGDAEAIRTAVLEGVLINGGRPVLVVPEDWGAKPIGRNIVIGWHPCRAAARAVHDALAILAPESTIDIAVVDPDIHTRAYGQEPGADIATALSRHGHKVMVSQLPAGGGSVADALLGHARVQDADLLVTGGYSHSRLREALLGGVTRELLHTARIPVLMSH